MRAEKTVRSLFFNSFFILAIIGLGYTPAFSQKKVNFRITKFPEYTPPNDTLYLCCSFNDWALKDESLRFSKLKDGAYFLSIILPDNQDFEYKINRSTWETVEGNDVGEYKANRKFLVSANMDDVEIIIESWQDLHKKFLSALDVRVVSVPGNTPKNAKLYITGTFNNWNQSDPSAELVMQKDGSYHGLIDPGLETFEYKITRGSWESVEGRWDGGFKANRFYKVKLGEKNQIFINISSWEDLSKWPYWKMFLFLVFIIQAVQLTVIIFYSKYNKLLLVLSIMLVLGFFIRLAYNYRDLYTILPFGYLLPACIYAFIMPWYYSWLKNSYSPTGEHSKIERQSWTFLIPFFSIVIGIISVSLASIDFMGASIAAKLDIYFLLRYGFAIGLNLFFSRKTMDYIALSKDEIPNWIKTASKVLQLNWYIAIIVVVLMSVSKIFDFEANFITEWTENLLWISLGVLVIHLEWIVLRHNRNVAILEKNKNREFSEAVNWNALKEKLVKLMDEEAAYVNPQITLSDLALSLGTNTFYVSRLINESFEQNFSDYINSYRIKAFIKTIKQSKSDNTTFLSVAYQVGFNSKSSFNRAFKKYTGLTPSEYFKS